MTLYAEVRATHDAATDPFTLVFPRRRLLRWWPWDRYAGQVT